MRHNNGGNIDSWLLDILQRRAWTYWESRATNITTGGEGWDEMFAFRGHLVSYETLIFSLLKREHDRFDKIKFGALLLENL